MLKYGVCVLASSRTSLGCRWSQNSSLVLIFCRNDVEVEGIPRLWSFHLWLLMLSLFHLFRPYSASLLLRWLWFLGPSHFLRCFFQCLLNQVGWKIDAPNRFAFAVNLVPHLSASLCKKSFSLKAKTYFLSNISWIDSSCDYVKTLLIKLFYNSELILYF